MILVIIFIGICLIVAPVILFYDKIKKWLDGILASIKTFFQKLFKKKSKQKKTESPKQEKPKPNIDILPDLENLSYDSNFLGAKPKEQYSIKPDELYVPIGKEAEEKNEKQKEEQYKKPIFEYQDNDDEDEDDLGIDEEEEGLNGDDYFGLPMRAYGISNPDGIKEQIQNLSPEMKAILLTNLLDKKKI